MLKLIKAKTGIPPIYHPYINANILIYFILNKCIIVGHFGPPYITFAPGLTCSSCREQTCATYLGGIFQEQSLIVCASLRSMLHFIDKYICLNKIIISCVP